MIVIKVSQVRAWRLLYRVRSVRRGEQLNSMLVSGVQPIYHRMIRKVRDRTNSQKSSSRENITGTQ